jgi:hypothetical protein
MPGRISCGERCWNDRCWNERCWEESESKLSNPVRGSCGEADLPRPEIMSRGYCPYHVTGRAKTWKLKPGHRASEMQSESSVFNPVSASRYKFTLIKALKCISYQGAEWVCRRAGSPTVSVCRCSRQFYFAGGGVWT